MTACFARRAAPVLDTARPVRAPAGPRSAVSGRGESRSRGSTPTVAPGFSETPLHATPALARAGGRAPPPPADAAPAAREVDIDELLKMVGGTVDEALALRRQLDEGREDLEILRQQFVLQALRGPGVGSPVGAGTADLVEALIETSAFLAPYLRGKLAKTTVRKNFKRYDDDAEFLRKADELDHVVRPITGAHNRDAPRPMGFYHRKSDSIHLPPAANLGHAVHEALHRYSSPATQNVFGVFLNEGFTQYLTDRVLAEQQVEGQTRHQYQRQLACARKVIGWTSPERVARAYFSGNAGDLLDVVMRRIGVNGSAFVALVMRDDGEALCERIDDAKP